MKRMFARVAAFLAIFALSATAAEITSEDARALFKRWAGSGVRLGSNFSADISDVSGHLAGTNRFFSVKLKDGKSVILSGDSSAKNPVIAFSTSGDMPASNAVRMSTIRFTPSFSNASMSFRVALPSAAERRRRPLLTVLSPATSPPRSRAFAIPSNFIADYMMFSNLPQIPLI